MNRKKELADIHSFSGNLLFKIKCWGLIGIRLFQNFRFPPTRFHDEGRLNLAPVIAVSKSDLWNPFDNEKNWILTAGKVENLRIAAKKIHGIEVKANQVFSFWKQIGNPSIGKGFVIGREIREGCIIPTIAGGLCQLSNALYDAALKANCDIIERHRHTKVIQGSLAEKDRDATVKWNYLDLRFKAMHDFRIEAELNSNHLVIRFRSFNEIEKENSISQLSKPYSKLNDCYSCGNSSCHLHPEPERAKRPKETTTYILDESWPEYDSYLTTIKSKSDVFIIPFKKNKFLQISRYQWISSNGSQAKTTHLPALFRMLAFRLFHKKNPFELGIKFDKKIAEAGAKMIPMDTTHLVISQNLLPFIYNTGVLGGRTFDVFMTRLPLEKLQEKLDYAYLKHPESKTLNDFRANTDLINIENQALTEARQIITSHQEIASIFNHKVNLLPWQIPVSKTKARNGSKILFPASGLGRKGAYIIKRLALDLKFKLIVLGKANEHPGFWNGVETETFGGNWEEVGLVLYPTYIENQPRLLLKTLGLGIPVITTKASGLQEKEGLIITDTENYEDFKNLVITILNKKN